MIYLRLSRFSYFGRLLITCLFALMLPLSLTYSAHEHMHAPTFSNPAEYAPVEPSWHEKSVTYDARFKDADLVLSLGQQTHPLFEKLIAEYASKRNLKIVLLHGTCGITSGRLLRKKIDVGAFCCPPGKNDRLPGMKFYSLGISPIALIVHPANPVSNVSSKMARDIFTGRIARWDHVKGDGPKLTGRIKPVARLHCKIRPGHWRLLLENENTFSPGLFEVGVISDMISQIARSKNAIGWEVPLMLKVYRNKGEVKMLKIDGHAATDLNAVLEGKYPLYRSYSLTIWEKSEKKKLATDIVTYLRAQIEKDHDEVAFIAPSQLRKAGWKFLEDELIGEPESRK